MLHSTAKLSVWRDKQEGTCLLQTRCYFRPVNQSWEPQCTALHWLQTSPSLFHPIFWRCYHWNQIPMLGLALNLISHENVFEAFQPMWSQSTNVADRQTCDCKTALHTIVMVTTFQTTWNSLTFPVEATKDYLVSSVYWYGQQSLFHTNEKQGEAK